MMELDELPPDGELGSPSAGAEFGGGKGDGGGGAGQVFPGPLKSLALFGGVHSRLLFPSAYLWRFKSFTISVSIWGDQHLAVHHFGLCFCCCFPLAVPHRKLATAFFF